MLLIHKRKNNLNKNFSTKITTIDKEYLVYNSINNLILFFSWNRSITATTFHLYKPHFFFNFNYLFLDKNNLGSKKFNQFYYNLNYNKNKLINLSINLFKYIEKIKFKFYLKQNNLQQQKLNLWVLTKKISKGFILIWSTWNNFFVTILDNWGHTLISWTGGNNGRTSTWQRSSVFSSDNATYECCVLAKQWGLQSVDVHLLSSLWIPQIKSSLSGLQISGLKINSFVYRPKFSIGGCWPKKPRRV